jgi:hypothetical protein
MSLSARGLIALAVAVCATALAGCGGDPVSSAPATLSDPAGFSSDVESLDTPFAAPVLQSFAAVGGSTPLAARTTSLFAALSPSRPTISLRATGSRRQALAMKALKPTFATAPAGPGSLIPDSLWGRVYVWDPATDEYVEGSTTGGPADGVRFTLYQLEGNVPVEPLNPIGYADLSDESTTSQYKLGVLVADPTTTYADYAITATATASSFSAAATGFITDGTHRLDFDNSGSASSTQIGIDFSLSLNQPDISAHLGATLTAGNPTSVLSLSFEVTRGTETVALNGTLAATITQSSATATANLTISVNSSRFATITGTVESGTSGSYTYSGPDRPLTDAERAAVNEMLTAPSTIVSTTDPVFAPAEDLIGSSYSLGL